ncbi:18862_t:CDS:1, partial [Acaulospora morrowiae]
ARWKTTENCDPWKQTMFAVNAGGMFIRETINLRQREGGGMLCDYDDEKKIDNEKI